MINLDPHWSPGKLPRSNRGRLFCCVSQGGGFPQKLFSSSCATIDMHQLFNFCSPKHHCAKTGTRDVNFNIIATVMQQRNKQTNKQIKEMLNLGEEEWDNIHIQQSPNMKMYIVSVIQYLWIRAIRMAGAGGERMHKSSRRTVTDQNSGNLHIWPILFKICPKKQTLIISALQCAVALINDEKASYNTMQCFY